MKVVILAGGFGTRLSEHTTIIPKPMAEVGGLPMLWHIMSLYSYYGFNDFIIAGGYKVEVIKQYFLNYHALSSDFKINIPNGDVIFFKNPLPNWNVTVVDTGKDTMTGGRLLKLKELLGKDQFLLTYGDGVSDVNLNELVDFHNTHNAIVTLTAVHPKTHYGELDLQGDNVVRFFEKPEFRQSWINGGFMVVNSEIFDFIDNDQIVFERQPLEQVTLQGKLNAFKHHGFWQCMDTLRDLNNLNDLWARDEAPWKMN